MNHQLELKENGNGHKDGRVIAFTSGKGGVGTSNVVVNLAFAFTQLNKKVLLLDANVGLANIDVLLGLTPKYTLNHVLNGQKKISEVIIPGPGGMKVIPASLGVQKLANLTTDQKISLLSEFTPLSETIDIFLIDTGSGISSNVIYFNLAAQENVLVTTPEPTSVTDAYALLKILSKGYSKSHFKLLINAVKNEREAKQIYENLSGVTEEFLNLSLDYWGYILYDRNISKAVKQQKIITELYPDSRASKCFYVLAKKICESKPDFSSAGGINFFLNLLIKRNEIYEYSFL